MPQMNRHRFIHVMCVVLPKRTTGNSDIICLNITKLKVLLEDRICGPVICPVCHTYHHSRERLFDHLKPEKHGPTRCLMLLNQRGSILTQKQANNLDAEDRPYHLALFKKGRRRNCAEHPPFRVWGPLITPELFLNNPNNNNIIVF